MQKETETEETIGFFGTFLSLVKFQLGGRPCPSPIAYSYAPSAENKKGVRNFSARFLAFSNEISTVQKIVLSSSRGQANFRGLEASRPRPRTSKCVLEDVLEAKDVFEDSTYGCYHFVSLQGQRVEICFHRSSQNGSSLIWKFVEKQFLKTAVVSDT